MKICSKCKTEKPLDNFYFDKGKNSHRYMCRACENLRIIEIQHAYKQKCVDYKGGKCVICEYDRYIGALEFHHRDPSQKDFSLSSNKLKRVA
jgi:hypothetical protein